MTACGWIGLADFCAAVVDWWDIILWGLLWLAVVAGSWLIGWYFPTTKPYAGFVVFVLGAFIIGMIKGILKQKKRFKERNKPAPVVRPQPQPTIPFAWLWEWR